MIFASFCLAACCGLGARASGVDKHEGQSASHRGFSVESRRVSAPRPAATLLSGGLAVAAAPLTGQAHRCTLNSMSAAQSGFHVLWACALLLALLQTAAPLPASSSGQRSQQAAEAGGEHRHQIVATAFAPIRITPPTPWFLGLPGWAIAHTEVNERYKLLRTLEIRVFSSTYAWAEVELASPADDADPKSGWVYWGESFTGDGEDFEYADRAVFPPTVEGRR